MIRNESCEVTVIIRLTLAKLILLCLQAELKSPSTIIDTLKPSVFVIDVTIVQCFALTRLILLCLQAGLNSPSTILETLQPNHVIQYVQVFPQWIRQILLRQPCYLVCTGFPLVFLILTPGMLQFPVYEITRDSITNTSQTKTLTFA